MLSIGQAAWCAQAHLGQSGAPCSREGRQWASDNGGNSSRSSSGGEVAIALREGWLLPRGSDGARVRGNLALLSAEPVLAASAKY